MDYFNYFIKCIIRNISYRLCKPKVLLTVLLSVSILFGLKHFGYCAWDEGDIYACLEGFSVITNNQGVMISQLATLGADVRDIETKLDTVNTTLSNISTDTNNIAEKLYYISQDIEDINTNILNIYNSLEKNQQELISELQTENQKVLDELQQLRDALVGSEATPISSTKLGSVSVNVGGTNYSGISVIEIPMEYGYTYTINLTYKNTSSKDQGVLYMFYDKYINNTSEVINSKFKWANHIYANSTTNIKITTRDYQNKYLYLFWDQYLTDVKVTASIEGVVDVIDRTNQEINTGIQEGNQLQQEQNNILTNDEVNTDGLQFAQDNTNNPTSEGFDTLFMTIYNAFCNSTSSPLTVNLPFVNQTFTISPNLVSQGMQKMRSWFNC